MTPLKQQVILENDARAMETRASVRGQPLFRLFGEHALAPSFLEN